MKMIGSGAIGLRHRYLAEQAAFMEELSKSAGFTTPITKPVASFKAPAASVGAKPKIGSLKPTGSGLPTASQRLSALKQNLVGQTTPGGSTPAAAGSVGAVGKASRLRRRGKFQPVRASSPVALLSRDKIQAPNAAEPLDVFTKAWMPKAILKDSSYAPKRFIRRVPGFDIPAIHPQATKLMNYNKTAQRGSRAAQTTLRPMPGLFQQGGKFAKREPLQTSVSEDDARKLVERHGLKGPLPKHLDREQKMAAYEARYVTAGGKKAEKWDRRARTADKIKTGGLAVATAGGAGWLATRGRLKTKAFSPKVRHHAETIAGAGATAGGAGELYAGHARRKRSSYASAPAGVAASALRRMRDYTA